jgi:hypothetical protein
MDDRAFIRQFEGFHSRRFVVFTALGVLGFALVLAVVVLGFRRNPSPTRVGPASAASGVR